MIQKNRLTFLKILPILRLNTRIFAPTAIDQIIKEYGRDPFLILMSCLLSLRTRDRVSVKISQKLFERASTPAALIRLSQDELEKIIRPVGFYRSKAATLKEVSNKILTQFNSTVPQKIEELLSLKGIGRKTANLVIGYAYNIPALCVDTHVHRLSNRLGLVQTKTVEQTETALKKIVPKNCWIELNRLMVSWGQNVCRPVSPACSQCSIFYLCQRANLKKIK